MTKLCFSGSTDVAEMALFALDALPDRAPSEEDLAALEGQHLLVRFETGADGSYLLHAYVDEEIPTEVMRFCAAPGRSGRLRLVSGSVGFGSSESAHAKFAPNADIRTEGRLAPGDYRVDAWFTQFPPGLVQAAIAAEIGVGGVRFLALPGYVIPAAVLLVIVLLLLEAWWLSAAAALAAILGMKALYFDGDRVQALEARKEQIERRFPGIVVAMARD